jgi:hypothetical protein
MGTPREHDRTQATSMNKLCMCVKAARSSSRVSNRRRIGTWQIKDRPR